ncbi:phospho-sugar mutase [Brevibacillus ruminantium]|uniref:Phospho-sugar mutase n=1 Tax=Brevibacillus ruminantium TaxID=2950604 RepID=A0ABY4W918_9BACL|nr:phospho-sugar mutase [Brevibacillus ruminantium]USG63346.1 phospho-sugar mutase [Brevibacillus ruminantium]
MLTWRKRFQYWLDHPDMDADMRQQLLVLKERDLLLEDCFFQNIDFGTGGIRGEMGPGPNRMNAYTVRKVMEGFARYLLQNKDFAKEKGIVIAYDPRHQSSRFAWEAARLMGNHGFRVFFFERVCPTPLLSFAIRHLKAVGGVMITASHNPPTDNGCKLYDADGCQLTPETASHVMHQMNKIIDELAIPTMTQDALQKSGLLLPVFDELAEAYFSCLEALRPRALPYGSVTEKPSIVYTPLNGAAYEIWRRGLERFGFAHALVVTEQAAPDPDFRHAPVLNPEDPESFSRAIQYGSEAGADLLLATDPDADRVGAAIPTDSGTYEVLTGNQLGALLLDYILSAMARSGILPVNGVVLKTIVSSELCTAIAREYGIPTVDTLTGFKFIGEKMSEYQQTGEYRFLFGMEESNGYVFGDHIRDKDGIQSALLAADMCAFHKAQGRTLKQQLEKLYRKHGYYREMLMTFTQKGKAGMERISSVMEHFRNQTYTSFAGLLTTAIEDYQTGERQDLLQGQRRALTLPRSNVRKYFLEDESWFCLRPSGTEPKLKCYIGVKGSTLAESKRKIEQITQAVQNIIRPLLADLHS